MPAWAVAATILGAIGAVVTIAWCAWVAVRAFRHRHDPPLATKPDIDAVSEQIKVLEEQVSHPPEYLDGLPEAVNDTLRAAYQEARVLQLEGYQAQNAERHREAVEQFTRALPLAETDSQRAALHIVRGNSLDSIGDWSAAMDDYQAALRLSQDISPPEEANSARAAALGDLGLVYRRRGDLEQAEELQKQCLEINRRINNRSGEATAANNLGNVYADRGCLERAEEQYKQALEAYRRIREPLGQARALGNLGNVYSLRGDLKRAEEHYSQVLEICRPIDDRMDQANAFGNLGNVYYLRGDLKQAEEHYRQALELFRRISNPLGEAKQLGNLGGIYARRGDLDRAEEHQKQALGMFRRIEDPLGQANQLASLSLLAEQRGRPEEARRLLREALALYERMGAGGEGPDTVRAALRRLEEAGGEEKPRHRARKQKDQEPPAG